MYDFKIRRQ